MEPEQIAKLAETGVLGVLVTILAPLLIKELKAKVVLINRFLTARENSMQKHIDMKIALLNHLWQMKESLIQGKTDEALTVITKTISTISEK